MYCLNRLYQATQKYFHNLKIKSELLLCKHYSYQCMLSMCTSKLTILNILALHILKWHLKSLKKNIKTKSLKLDL